MLRWKKSDEQQNSSAQFSAQQLPNESS